MRILTPDDQEWQDIYDRLPMERRDVFYSPGFARACEIGLYDQSTVKCAADTSAQSPILYPIVERDLGSMLPDWQPARALRDATGLYGRGGIVSTGDNTLSRFHKEIAAYFRQRRIVSAFDRYHPVIKTELAAAPSTQVRDVGGFVVVPLSLDMADIELAYKGKQRNTLRKGERLGVRAEFERGTDHLDEFLRIYSETMKRNEAESFYHFDRRFFTALSEHLPDNTIFAYATFEDEIVSCDLILFEPPFAHLFLSGTDPAHMDKGPNTKLKHETFRYLKNLGCQYYLLGGGHEPQDGVFRYKQSFAPAGCVPSLVGGTVYLMDEYQALRQDFENQFGQAPGQRFQFYDAAA